MNIQSNDLLKYFKGHGGVVRSSAVREAGFYPALLTVLKKDGRIEKISRGLYKLSGYDLGQYSDLILSSLQVTNGVICLISALSFHEATSEIPGRVDIAIPRGVRAGKVWYPPVKIYRFSPSSWELGVEEHKIEGRVIRVYSLAKTIVDCFKFRNQIGVGIARAALKYAIENKKARPKDIIDYAKICRVDNIIKPVLEAML